MTSFWSLKVGGHLVAVKFGGYADGVKRPNYHHGDLRAAILTEAARLVAERGADGVSLRELARSAGVSHAAPAHHFTDRRGLFTALATQGFQLLARALIDARGRFADAALAYVGFALEHPGHYRVMFDKSLLDATDTELAAAEAAAGAELSCGWRRCGIPARRPTHGCPAGGMVTGTRVFDAVAQRRGQRSSQAGRSDGHRRADSDDAIRRVAALLRRPFRSPVSSAETRPG